jgi:hypothetical protein
MASTVSGCVADKVKVILFANTEWYLFNFRLSLARALRDQGAEVVMLSPPGPYGPMLREAGFRWEPLAMDRRSLNPFRELGLLRSLARFYRLERPDAVHHFTLKCVVYGSLAAAWARVPFIVNAVAGLGYVFTNPSPQARLLRPMVRGALRFALNRPNARLILQNMPLILLHGWSDTSASFAQLARHLARAGRWRAATFARLRSAITCR